MTLLMPVTLYTSCFCSYAGSGLSRTRNVSPPILVSLSSDYGGCLSVTLTNNPDAAGLFLQPYVHLVSTLLLRLFAAIHANMDRPQPALLQSPWGTFINPWPSFILISIPTLCTPSPTEPFASLLPPNFTYPFSPLASLWRIINFCRSMTLWRSRCFVLVFFVCFCWVYNCVQEQRLSYFYYSPGYKKCLWKKMPVAECNTNSI